MFRRLDIRVSLRGAHRATLGERENAFLMDVNRTGITIDVDPIHNRIIGELDWHRKSCVLLAQIRSSLQPICCQTGNDIFTFSV